MTVGPVWVPQTCESCGVVRRTADGRTLFMDLWKRRKWWCEECATCREALEALARREWVDDDDT